MSFNNNSKIRPRTESSNNDNNNNSNNNKKPGGNEYDWRKDPKNPAAALLRKTGGRTVQNKTTAQFQVTAEQLIADSYKLHATTSDGSNRMKTKSRQSDLVLTTRDELEAYQSMKRTKFEEILRRDMTRISNWLAFAAWEERQGAMGNVRALFERALLQFGTQKPEIWIQYAKAEIRCGDDDVDGARSVLERAIQTLPGENSLWLHAILLEKTTLSNRPSTISARDIVNNNIRDLFTQWLSYKPGHPAWREWIRFELSLLVVSSEKKNEEMSWSPSSSSTSSQVERVRNLLNRYVTEHNSADSWLFYAACEQEIAKHENLATPAKELSSPSSSSWKISAAKRAVKILETGLQSVPESEKDQTDAARLALAMAKAYEVAQQDNKARQLYVKLLDEFLDESEAASGTEVEEDDDELLEENDGDDVETSSAASKGKKSKSDLNKKKSLQHEKRAANQFQVELKKQLRDSICDSLSALEKRSGSLDAAAAVEQRKQRWILEQKIKRGENPNNPEFFDETSTSLAKLQLLRLERKFLLVSQNQLQQKQQLQQPQGSSFSLGFDEQQQRTLTKIATLYERFCFPSFYLATSSFLEGLSICWESFVLFCEQDLLSQQAATGVMKKAIDFLRTFGTSNTNSNTISSSSSSSSSSSTQTSSVSSSFLDNKNKTLLLSKLLETTAMLHLRHGDLVKFRMCMRLAVDILGNFSDEVFAATMTTIVPPSGSPSDDRSAEAETTSATLAREDMFGFSSNLRIVDDDFELHPLFGIILRWIEVEKKCSSLSSIADSNNTVFSNNNNNNSYKQINDILFFALKFKLCRRSVDLWHLRADAVRQLRMNSATPDLKGEISVLEEALEEIFGRFVASFDQEVEDAYNSIIVRLLKIQLVEVQDPELAVNVLEKHCEKIEELYVNEYSTKRQKQGDGGGGGGGDDNADDVDDEAKTRAAEVAAEKLRIRRRWYDSLLTSVFQMMQQFFFSVYSTTNEHDEKTGDEEFVALVVVDEAKAIAMTRDFYRRAFTRIRRKCGTEVSVVAVMKLWRPFEEEYGNEDTRKQMIATSTAATQRTNRLFDRAKKK